jgi:hypothetical protein
MQRVAHVLANAILLACAGFLAACGSSASGALTTGSAANAAPGNIGNDHPLARPVQVAWTSARAQRCGFYFDPTKLRGSYLSYEAKQSSPEQLAKAEKTYDSTFKTIYDKTSADPDYCTDRTSSQIKADLQRHLAGDFTPKLPAPKTAETCGFFGCPVEKSDEPLDARKMYDELSRKNAQR